MSGYAEIEESQVQKLERLKQLIEHRDPVLLSEFIDSQNAIDFAQEVADLEDEELDQLLPLLDNDELALLLEESDDHERFHIAPMLPNERLLMAFQYMQKDDIVDLLGDFPIGRRKQVVNLMKADDRRIINNLLQYPEDSAGGIMTTAYIALRLTNA